MRQRRSVEQLAQSLGVSRPLIRSELRELAKHGYHLLWSADCVKLEKSPGPLGNDLRSVSLKMRKLHQTKVGIISDTHMGSKFCRLDVLHAAYEDFKKAGIKDVFHAGNMVDGESILNRYDLEIHGFADQVQYVVDNYPKVAGITTHFIDGDDHEGWWTRREGIRFGPFLETAAREQGRTDLHYLGYSEADVKLDGPGIKKPATMRIMHPGGGSSYAISYQAQKIVESYGPNGKPDILIVGHYHKMGYFRPRGVHCILAGCFTSVTRIDTEHGRIPISRVRRGDRVWTHKQRWGCVTKTYKRRVETETLTIVTGKSKAGPSRGQVTATPEHPFLTPTGWVEAGDLRVGDWVAVKSHMASDGSLVPWFRKTSNGQLYNKNVRGHQAEQKYRGHEHNRKLERYVHDSYPDDRVLILAGVVPDAIVVNWEKKRITAVEIENNRSCPQNPNKYIIVPGMYDEVDWVCDGKSSMYQRREYREIDGNIFVQIKKIGRNPRRCLTVYNLAVEEDESYVAGFHVVHNCTQDQTTWMRKLRLEAHLGWWILGITQDVEGAVVGVDPKAAQTFDRRYYE